jgi:phosphinothricin acetyltransferase
VYVAQDYVGQGIGGKLLEALIELAKSEGYHVMVGGIDADNSGSIACKRYGFVENGVIREAGFKFGRWLDLMFMQLILE